MSGAPQSPPGEWRFLQLTIFIAAWMLVSPHLSDRWIVQVLLQIFLANSVLVTLWANPQWVRMRRLLIALWLVSLGGSLVAVLPLESAWQQLGRTTEAAASIPLLALLAAGMLLYAFGRETLTPDGIFATVAAYLLVAFLFAQVYLLALTWNPDSFSLPVAAGERSTQQLQGDMMYFSLVTLATLGYGDMLPRGDTVRAVAVIEAVIGQFYVAVIVAVFVGMYAARLRTDRP